MSEEIAIRNCRTHSEFHECVALQREIWGEEPLEVEPASMFVVAAHAGGQVIGAFAGDVLAGFIMAVAGVREGKPYLHSHFAGIKERFRDQGVGRRLKLFQREEALQRGISSIEWTFDPLEVRNAHFNLNRLGAIARKYLPNWYGVTTSPLHRGLRTDRLLAEWHLEDPNVMAKVASAGGGAAGAKAPGDAGLRGSTLDGVRIPVPAIIPYGVGNEEHGASAVQDRLREEFTKWFGRGHVATAFLTGEHPAYLLTKVKALGSSERVQ